MLSKRLIFSILWSLLILILSGLPGHDIPQFHLFDLLRMDKIVHMTMYSIFVSLWANTFAGQKKYSKLNESAELYAFSIGVGFGTMMEVMQGTICIDRSAEWGDVLANTIGSLAGIGFYRLVLKRRLT